MVINTCPSVTAWLLRQVILRRNITSLWAFAIQEGFDYKNLLAAAHRLEREGKVTIKRDRANGPLVIEPAQGITQPNPVGPHYQERMF
jgi:hypothetical protein